jgi:hypothetical protein
VQNKAMSDLICCKHKPTPRDIAQIEDFKRYLKILGQGQDEFHLSHAEAQRYAAMEVYGDVHCEGELDGR